jgi:hypothetical protein
MEILYCQCFPSKLKNIQLGGLIKMGGIGIEFYTWVLVHVDDVHLLVTVYILYRKTQKLQQSLVRRLVKK